MSCAYLNVFTAHFCLSLSCRMTLATLRLSGGALPPLWTDSHQNGSPNAPRFPLTSTPTRMAFLNRVDQRASKKVRKKKKFKVL